MRPDQKLEAQLRGIPRSLLITHYSLLLGSKLPVFLGDVFEHGFDGGHGIAAVGLLERYVAIAAE